MIGQIATDGGTGYCVEYTGPAVESLTMEERMTVCNMTIEAGGRAGMIAPDETTFALRRRARRRGRPRLGSSIPRRARLRQGGRRRSLRHQPEGQLGHQPGQVAPVTASVPDPASDGEERALDTWA